MGRARTRVTRISCTRLAASCLADVIRLHLGDVHEDADLVRSSDHVQGLPRRGDSLSLPLSEADSSPWRGSTKSPLLTLRTKDCWAIDRTALPRVRSVGKFPSRNQMVSERPCIARGPSHGWTFGCGEVRHMVRSRLRRTRANRVAPPTASPCRPSRPKTAFSRWGSRNDRPDIPPRPEEGEREATLTRPNRLKAQARHSDENREIGMTRR